ncbi:MAG: tetratricopeptide repeat protein [Anaerolineae bacterium]|nr:tetratricopeptide repeat protein [Anaerolineae bacterium]MCO5190236.1 tetratricopeptide repeat protein [Anaerolineae bacterium]MCO5195332.1 tetratricopeptide repeat protein [Anaerolineae bacterium]MCO5197324.1 tetratricopeptide repeat protein [Anaerolineae bacterium]MCO5207790.1 tetratricopeptide repeat protein [Anaerolineae bacterium]
MTDFSNIIDVDEGSFDEDVLQQSWDVPVVVDFWAPWCGPCRMLGPMLEQLANEPGASFILAKVNVDDNPNLSIQCGIRSIPAVKAYVRGQIAAEFTGMQPEPILRQFLSKIAPNEEDFVLNEALSLMATHHWDEAEEAFRAILDEYPNDTRAALGLARVLLRRGNGEEAEEQLQRCRNGQELAQSELLQPLAGFLIQYADGWDDDDPSLIEMQYRQAARLFARQNVEAALDGLIDVLRQDKRYRKGEVRKVILAIFELLGDDDELTRQYRQELAMVLF